MPRRNNLSSFAKTSAAGATGGTVETVHAAAPAAAKPASKYHKINVYLTADEVRTIKLIGIDTGQGPSAIGARAIREWLERNGHARSKAHNA